MVDELHSQDLSNETAIIISAKHGQSPQNPESLTRIDDTPITNGINEGWAKTHPKDPPLLASGTDDDAFMQWLSNASEQAANYVKGYLWTHPATGTTITGATRTLLHSGLQTIYAGAAAAQFFGVPANERRHPNVYAIVQHGVVYTGGTKIAEHGGADPNDRHVPILVYVPGFGGSTYDGPVETTQIAPTILKLLGLDPSSLQAVKDEGTQVLPPS
jgi:cation transport regulator ChaC